MLKVEFIEPQEYSTYGEEEIIILPNGISSTLEDYHRVRAKEVSRRLGARILAYERPHTEITRSVSFGLRKRITNKSVAMMVETANQLNTVLENFGVTRVLVAGHSAGASEAIGITASEQLPIKHASFTDPPSIRKSLPIIGEFVEYGGYQLFTERNKVKLTDDITSSNCAVENEPTVLRRIQRTLGEIAIYSGLWRSTVALDGLRYIAAMMPDTRVNLVFPEYTFTAKPDVLQGIADELNAIRQVQTTHQPFDVDILTDRYHSYFDNNSRYADLVAKHFVS